MPIEQIAIIEFITFAAAFVQGLVGFGSSLIAVPSLLFLLDLKTISPLVTLFALVINMGLVARLWRYCQREHLFPLVGGALGGIPVGIVVLEYVPEAVIKVLLTTIILGYVAYSLLKPIMQINIDNRWGWLIGLVAGCLGSAVAANGPPIVIWATLQGWEKQEFRSNLTTYFGITGIVAIASYTVSGLVTESVLKYFVLCIPALLLGTALGDYLSQKLDQTKFRKMVQVLLIALALLLLLPKDLSALMG